MSEPAVYRKPSYNSSYCYNNNSSSNSSNNNNTNSSRSDSPASTPPRRRSSITNLSSSNFLSVNSSSSSNSNSLTRPRPSSDRRASSGVRGATLPYNTANRSSTAPVSSISPLARNNLDKNPATPSTKESSFSTGVRSASSHEFKTGNSSSSNNNNNNSDSSSEVSDEGYKSSHGGSRGGGCSSSSSSSVPKSVSQQIEEEETMLGGQGTNGDRPDSSNSLLLENSSECSSTISSSTEEGGEQEQDRVATPDDQELRDDPETSTEKTANSVRVRPAIPPQLKKKQVDNTLSDTPTITTTPALNSSCSSRPAFARSRSVNDEEDSSNFKTPTTTTLRANSFVRGGNERRSYGRSPQIQGQTSRYLQAAEQYAARSRSRLKQQQQQQQSEQHNNTWSGRMRRERSALGPDTFGSKMGGGTLGRTKPRTASASPAPSSMHSRMRRNYSSDSLKRSVTPTATSSSAAAVAAAARKRELEEARSATAKSTPVRKPSRNNNIDNVHGDEEEEDGAILKRMEEILMTYKSKVEDHLAAEGRELPADLFSDFTTQWVNEASSLAKNSSSKVSSNNRSSSRNRSGSRQRHPSNSSSSGSGLMVSGVRTTPTWRKDYREGQKSETKIPVPTFYNRE